MIDFHTHILPGVDDGSRSIEESLAILKQQYKRGTKAIIATPHFYPDDQLQSFLERRDRAMEQFEKTVEGENLTYDIAFKKGAEVLISVDTWKIENLQALCITGTRYILIELPYSTWSEWVYTSVQNIIDNHKLIPIIAHVERYHTVMENPNQLLRFIEMGALLQMNAYSLHQQSSRKKLCHKLIKHGMIHILGSDVHREDSFMPVQEGYELIKEKHGEKVAHVMQEISQSIYEGKEAQTIEPTVLKRRFGRWF